MFYPFYKIYLKWQANILLYMLFIIQVTVGISILFAAMNYYVSYNDELNEVKKISDTYESSLEINSLNEGENLENDERALTKSDLEYMNEVLDENYNVFFSDNELPITQKGNEVISGSVVYTNTAEKEALIKPQDKKIIQEMVTDIYELKENSISINGSKLNLVVTKNDNFNLFEKTNQMETYTPDEQEETISHYTLYVPLAYLSKKVIIYPGQIKLFLKKSKDITDVSSQKIDVINYLNKEHSKNNYTFSNSLQDFEKSVTGHKTYMVFFIVLSFLLLMMFFISFKEIMKIIINRRISEIALSSAVGATYKQLSIELFLESYSICLIGTIMGLVIGVLMSLKLTNEVFVNTIHVSLIFMIILFMTVVSLLSVVGATFKLLKRSTSELLRE